MGRKFEGVLLASDFDGTLLNQKREISAENREALEYFVENGGCFTPATGRVPNAALHYCATLPVNTPCIFLNGAVVYDSAAGRPLHTTGLPDEARALAKTLMREFPEIGIELFTVDGAFIAHPGKITTWHFESLHLPLCEVDLDAFLTPQAWCKMNLTGREEELEPVIRYLAPQRDAYEMSSSNPLFYEITAKGSDKGSAVLFVADHMGVSHTRVCAVGDSFNDMPMLKAAACSFAPANADPAILQQADVIVSDNDSHALRDVVDALERYGI